MALIAIAVMLACAAGCGSKRFVPPPPEPLPIAALASVPVREPVRSVAVPDDAKVAMPESPDWFLEDSGSALIAAGSGLRKVAVRIDGSGVVALDADSARPYLPTESPWADAKDLRGWAPRTLDPLASPRRLRVALADGSHVRQLLSPSLTSGPRPPNGDSFEDAEIALFRASAQGPTGFTEAWATRVDQAGRRLGVTADGKYWAVAASNYPNPPFSAWVVVGDMGDGRILWQTPETRAPGLHVRFEVLGDAEAVIVSPAEGGCTGIYPREGQPVLIPGPWGVSNVAGDRVYVLVSVEPKLSHLLVAYDIHGRPLWRAQAPVPYDNTAHRHGLVVSRSGEWVADLEADPVAIYAAR